MQESDQELMRAAAGGDDAAFHALVDRHAPALFRAAMALSRNRADAEDICQETFVGAYRGLRNFDGRASVKTWLLRILTRQAAKHWQRNRRGRAADSLHLEGGDERQDEALSTQSSTNRVEHRIDLMEVMKKLPEPLREVLVLREIQGLSYEEIAETLNIPRGTVESRLHRARNELREKLIRAGYKL